ncbi:glutathione S-transferase N-terminal domain-containing protein [Rhizobium calliandrae]|uniref:Glutathione S-transferase N-terminal domain-containing protein n=1 Tax=Rhizobium calliandrae TaxID=1312182 RepID=A0ABT7KKC4_9HYPH|nr:glutathione S-transferase N-terminal domain-containing protein [Rhizobium calliandrae]MDL2407674.1 glutathione S-transferase N-terminal domain-containing protein [Rhizobium calliandrae]
MKLYMHPAACSLSPHIVCRELGLEIELIEVDRKTHRTNSGDDYLAINGNGYVPALMLDDGSVLTEGPAIVQLLVERSPEGSRLFPKAGTYARSQVQSYLNFVTSELHKPMAMLFNSAYEGAHAGIHELVCKRLDWLNSRFAGAYLTGNNFTIADAYLFVCLNWSPWIKFDLTRWPALHGFMARVGARPKVREALQEEDLEAFEADGIFFAPQSYIDSAGRSGTPVRP